CDEDDRFDATRHDGHRPKPMTVAARTLEPNLDADVEVTTGHIVHGRVGVDADAAVLRLLTERARVLIEQVVGANERARLTREVVAALQAVVEARRLFVRLGR